MALPIWIPTVSHGTTEAINSWHLRHKYMSGEASDLQKMCFLDAGGEKKTLHQIVRGMAKTWAVRAWH